MKSPCCDCENQYHDKLYPVCYYPGKRPEHTNPETNRTLQIIDGVTYKNPCYRCQKASDYNQRVSLAIDLPPTYYGMR